MITKPEVYTEEFVKKELADILVEISTNREYVVMGEIFENRAYSSQRFSEWAEKFKDNFEISESIKKIKDVFEYRVNIGGLKGKLNPAMSIFNLKNNYGWRDNRDIDITTKGESMNSMSYDKAKDIITAREGSNTSDSKE